MKALRIKSLSKRFGGKYAVHGVDLEVEKAELLAVLGPSGCGKTSLLRLITGQLTPDRGSIFIMGEDVTGIPTCRRNIGFVFQSFALFPHMTVLENVMFPLSVRGMNRTEREKAAHEFLSVVKLEGLEARYPAALSGGEQQRVGLARALVYRPRIILLDEPLSNLDAKLREEMRVEVRRIIKKLGMTAVYVTHDQEEALSISDRMAVMSDGRILQAGKPEEIYAKPETSFVARFVGASNLLPAVVGRGGTFEIENEEGVELQGASCFEEGSRVEIVLKPEELRVKRAGETGSGAFAITCKLLTSSYRGGKTEYVIVTASGHTLRVLQEREELTPGGEVEVLLPGGELHAIPCRDSDC